MSTTWTDKDRRVREAMTIPIFRRFATRTTLRSQATNSEEAGMPKRIAELEAKIDAMNRALALMVEAFERMDARVGEWDRE